jgi:spermidine synthase
MSDAGTLAVRRDLLARGLPLLLFIGSGATGLMAQLCYSRYLAYIVGATAQAVSAVLAAFMTGLSLGAYLGGKWASRVKRPLLTYGVLEMLAGSAVAAAPAAFAALTPAYISLARAFPDSLLLLSIARWFLAFLVVLVPTVAMGATLPSLAKTLGSASAASDRERIRRERWLGALYALNTLGGAGGALAAAYLFLPRYGLRHTLTGAAVAGIGIGALACAVGLATGRREPDSQPTPLPDPVAPIADEGLLVLLAFASGWLSLGSEVVLTHLLALVVGNSAYAFGLILGTFLICLALGATLAPLAHRRLGPAAAGWAFVLAGLAFAAALPFWDDLPKMFAERGVELRSFAEREWARGWATFLMLALPVTAMGLVFPLVLQHAADRAGVARAVGRATAANTVGAVLGSLAMGYLLLPWLGSERALGVTAAALAACGVAWMARAPARRWNRIAAGAVAGVTLLGLAFEPGWDLAALTSGTNVYFGAMRTVDAVPFVNEDIRGGVTTVARTGGIYTLYTNGKFQGDNTGEMIPQRLFAHYPSLFVSHFDHALLIGFGTGTTAGTLAAYPWQSITAVEISPAVVTAARRYFGESNGRALDDPRLRLVIDDGRHFLELSQDRYHLVCMELSSVWFAGASSLYSREFYALVREHLAPDGVFQQWIQLHHLMRSDIASIIATLRAEFEHVALFLGGNQGVLVASRAPLSASRARLLAHEQNPRIVASLPGGRRLETMLDDCLLTGRSLDRYLEASAAEAGTSVAALVSNDDNVRLEFSTPRGNVLPWNAMRDRLEELRAFRDPADVAALNAP